MADALRANHFAVARALLAKGADVNALSVNGTSPLDDACLRGQRELAELLLSLRANISERNRSGTTPLHDAALGGHPGIVGLLLDHGADIDIWDQESGATPLYYAASLGRTEVVELLIDRGADISLKNRRGLSPLEAALENNQAEVADVLRCRVLNARVLTPCS